MSLVLRIALVIGALLLLAYMFKKVRSTPVQVVDTIFWFFIAVLLLIMAIFPGISYFLSDLLEVQSPANLVFLVVMAVVILRVFLSSLEIALLKNRVNALSQEIALKENELRQLQENK